MRSSRRTGVIIGEVLNFVNRIALAMQRAKPFCKQSKLLIICMEIESIRTIATHWNEMYRVKSQQCSSTNNEEWPSRLYTPDQSSHLAFRLSHHSLSRAFVGSLVSSF